eukprot:CAMPEP_0198690586 /NCGR_PEP_ID=MMETSP1468-20131203/179656_1 /TAXON_ID=1461545 /ORGANISM="Mantoniella sp, Strain CCMP1436" /LENGTH=178 /DNA_ID=CAMNT_0044442961 /DNA_START=98 /DNA_END=631 /DNA_ORIENTATION=+
MPRGSFITSGTPTAAASRAASAAALPPHDTVRRRSRLTSSRALLSCAGTTTRRGQRHRHRLRHAGVVVAELPSLIPSNASDALGRFRKVMTVLYAGGGLLHFPDLLGRGPISAAVGASSFEALSPVLQAVTVGWSVLGPVAALGMGTGRAWGEAVMVAVASAEIVLGVDFTDAMAPAA